MTALLVLLAPAGGPTATGAGLRMWIPTQLERGSTPAVPAERTAPRVAFPEGSVGVPSATRRDRLYPSEGKSLACCAPARRPGWLVRFRKSGRGFYAYVFGTTAQAKRDAFTALSSLLVDRH
jgi:hypothetical protein